MNNMEILYTHSREKYLVPVIPYPTKRFRNETKRIDRWKVGEQSAVKAELESGESGGDGKGGGEEMAERKDVGERGEWFGGGGGEKGKRVRLK